MTDTPAHTPLPWKHQSHFQNVYALSDGDVGLTIHIAKTNEAQVAGGYAEAEANAAFIVRACNSHYQLVDSLREAREQILSFAHARGSECEWPDEDLVGHIDAAITAAGGVCE